MGRGKSTPQDEAMKNIISSNIKKYLNLQNKKAIDLQKGTGISQSSISEYINGKTLPNPGNLQKIADFFDVLREDIDPRHSENWETQQTESPILTEINRISPLLEEPRQQIVLDTIQEQLLEQNSSTSSKNTINYKTLPVRGIEASKNGHWYNENIFMDVQIPVSIIPENYDELVIILGESMRPHLEHGELLFIQTSDKKANLEIEEGQLGLFNTSEGIFIKKYRNHYLESLNSDFKHVFFKDDDHLKTLGVVVKTIKNNTYN
ncbi:LexA family transcriptional regulator [Lactococcus lactis]